MGQRLLAWARQVESLTAKVAALSQEIRQLKHENRDLHRHFLPSSSGVRPSIEAPNNLSSVPPSSRVSPSTKASSTEASHK
ncbi:hypothetical protein ACFXTO_037735 [Malus domestica]